MMFALQFVIELEPRRIMGYLFSLTSYIRFNKFRRYKYTLQMLVLRIINKLLFGENTKKKSMFCLQTSFK